METWIAPADQTDCRTSDKVTNRRTPHPSTMGVATGAIVCSTSLNVPAGAAPGPGELRAIANGIESSVFTVSIA